MAKLFYLATVFLLVGLTCVPVESSAPWYHSLLSFFVAPVTICGNPTVQTQYYTSTLALINNLQANATTNAIVAWYFPNFVAYIKSPASLALLNSNCTAFVINVKAAQAQDTSASQAGYHLYESISKQINQIPHTVTNSSAPNVLDNYGKGEHSH